MMNREKYEVWELVERKTDKVVRSGNYWDMSEDCLDRGTCYYYVREKQRKDGKR